MNNKQDEQVSGDRGYDERHEGPTLYIQDRYQNYQTDQSISGQFDCDIAMILAKIDGWTFQIRTRADLILPLCLCIAIPCLCSSYRRKSQLCTGS
jgi:hypothetical protein